MNLEDRTASKQEENPLYDLQAGDSGYGSSLNEEKKKQSHSFLTENKRSTTEHIAAKSDPKSHVSKNVSVQ